MHAFKVKGRFQIKDVWLLRRLEDPESKPCAPWLSSPFNLLQSELSLSSNSALQGWLHHTHHLARALYVGFIRTKAAISKHTMKWFHLPFMSEEAISFYKRHHANSLDNTREVVSSVREMPGEAFQIYHPSPALKKYQDLGLSRMLTAGYMYVWVYVQVHICVSIHICMCVHMGLHLHKSTGSLSQLQE